MNWHINGLGFSLPKAENTIGYRKDATYYAALAEREIYGDDYFYSKLYETAQQIKYASRTDTILVP
jgi:hypothetical protein